VTEPVNPRRKRVRTAVECVILVVLLGFIRVVARGAVYHPDRDDGRCPPPVARGPREPAASNLDFASADGTKLHGWLARYEGATRAVLFCHGNAGNVELEGEDLCDLCRACRAHVLLFDYRGYGRSAGSPFESGVCADARAALAALDQATGASPVRTVVVGHSLGGAVAIDLAAGTKGLAGLVVLSSFTSIDDMARAVTGVPGIGLLVPETYDSLGKVSAITCPKLFFHGDADTLIPFVQGQRLFQAAGEPKRFVAVPGASHEILTGRSGAGVFTEIGAFVDTVAPETSR
jgi:pimeloyl-ACP methyl ester carboxylesterase